MFEKTIVVAIPKTKKPRLVFEFQSISQTSTPVKVMENVFDGNFFREFLNSIPSLYSNMASFLGFQLQLIF